VKDVHNGIAYLKTAGWGPRSVRIDNEDPLSKSPADKGHGICAALPVCQTNRSPSFSAIFQPKAIGRDSLAARVPVVESLVQRGLFYQTFDVEGIGPHFRRSSTVETIATRCLWGSPGRQARRGVLHSQRLENCCAPRNRLGAFSDTLSMIIPKRLLAGIAVSDISSPGSAKVSMLFQNRTDHLRFFQVRNGRSPDLRRPGCRTCELEDVGW